VRKSALEFRKGEDMNKTTTISVRNVDLEEEKLAVKHLRRQGMTLSGFIRVKIRELAEQEKVR
jgi:hypothetical protein